MAMMVRRVIPADNSCLFNALGYVMEHNKHKAPELREVIAATVISDPETYNEAFLGKQNEEYCNWIMNPEKWGGAIELAILSEHYGREIAAYDIQTTRCDLYGQGKGFSERVMLIYDGVHYDALAMVPFENAPEDLDQTIFSVGGHQDAEIAANLARKLVDDANRMRNFTDTSKFTLRCAVCQKGVIGQKESFGVVVGCYYTRDPVLSSNPETASQQNWLWKGCVYMNPPVSYLRCDPCGLGGNTEDNDFMMNNIGSSSGMSSLLRQSSLSTATVRTGDGIVPKLTSGSCRSCESHRTCQFPGVQMICYNALVFFSPG